MFVAVQYSVSKGASKTRDPRSEPDFWLIREPYVWRTCDEAVLSFGGSHLDTSISLNGYT